MVKSLRSLPSTVSGINFLRDGTENNDIAFIGVAQPFSIADAVEEVSVQTGNYSVEFRASFGWCLQRDHQVLTRGKRLHPEYGQRTVRTRQGNSAYHALQARLDRRFAHGFQLTASYTCSRSLDIASEGIGQTSNQYASPNLTSVPVARGGLRMDRGLSDCQRLTLIYPGLSRVRRKGFANRCWAIGQSLASFLFNLEPRSQSSMAPIPTATAGTRWITRTSPTRCAPEQPGRHRAAVAARSHDARFRRCSAATPAVAEVGDRRIHEALLGVGGSKGGDVPYCTEHASGMYTSL